MTVFDYMSNRAFCEKEGGTMAGQTAEFLGHIKKIIKAVREKGLGDEFFQETAFDLDMVKNQLELTAAQGAIFALILNESSFGKGITLPDLAKILRCDDLESLCYLADIKRLEQRRLVQRSVSSFAGDECLRVPESICAALARGKLPKRRQVKNLSPEQFFEEIDRALRRLREDKKLFMHIVAGNMQLPICKIARSLEPRDALLLLYICRRLVIEGNGKTREGEIKRILRIFSGRYENRTLGELRRGEHRLIKDGYIEFAGGGIRDGAEFSLTKRARNDLLEGVEIYECEGENKKDMLHWQDISEKKLFYNAGEDENILELAGLLKPEPFNSVRLRLAEHGRKTSFSCLFYGPPGTGKTESVYQIARAAQRDIVQVNIAETKSQWFGASEKLVKGIFDDYRNTVKRRTEKDENTPILFFNEADAIFGKRMALGDQRAGPAQTENAMQNILLDEIERLDGILIATTNLTGNFDNAFERRFLYKIAFTRPGPAVRASIWKISIPGLPETVCDMLAHKFDFSGGQIDNIVRKAEINFVLRGADPTPHLLEKYCNDELLEHEYRQIGFAL
jgi:broad-specificity NMP kinase